jgi:hypothetical protein
MTPVATLVAVTVTPGMRAPLASLTVPLILDWANTFEPTKKKQSRPAVTKILFMQPPHPAEVEEIDLCFSFCTNDFDAAVLSHPLNPFNPRLV